MPGRSDFFPKNDTPGSGGRVSKSEEKRRALRLREIGVAVTGLADSELARVPFGDNDSLREAILAARKLRPRSEELRRQILHIEALLRSVPGEEVGAIESMLKALTGAKVAENAAFHRLESLRDELIAAGTDKVNELAAAHPELDRQRLRALTLKAREEALSGSGARRRYRELFRFLKENIANQDGSND